MPFATGTARTPSELLNALNTHLVANGWTKLRGETDMACASPKAARYWRLLVWESQTTSSGFRGLQLFNLRTTSGGANVATVGANFSCSSVGTGTPSLMVAGGLLRSASIANQPWTVTYDFGAPTTIREFYLRGDSTIGNSPRDFAFQWSNDGEVWTTLNVYTSITWTASEYKTFTITDGFLFSDHVAVDAPRRSGAAEDFTTSSNLTTSAGRDLSEDYWLWQGPGYDASRRVYVHARSYCRQAASTHVIQLDYSIAYDAAIRSWAGQVGSSGLERCHLMDSGTVTYWIYSNSKRILLITRSGAQDYTSTYIGFMSAFALPNDYPFPLLISTTMPDRFTYTSGDVNARLSSMADPGLSATACRLWDGTLIVPNNRPSTGTSNLYLQKPTNSWVWPYHFGSTGISSSWPGAIGSDFHDYSPAHIFDYVSATQQNALPLIPCTVMHDPYGNIGVMDGVFAIPSGGILTPTQLITIGIQNYRVFPNRTRRESVAWFAVRED